MGGGAIEMIDEGKMLEFYLYVLERLAYSILRGSGEWRSSGLLFERVWWAGDGGEIGRSESSR